MGELDPYLCTCGLWHDSIECPTQGRTDLEMEMDREQARRCPQCRQVEDCLCAELAQMEEDRPQEA